MKKKIIFFSVFVFLLIFICFVSFNKESKTLFSSYTTNNMNIIWCETFQLAWNELKTYIGRDIEFDSNNNDFCIMLNNRIFDNSELSNKDYYVKVKENSYELKKEIENDIEKKFDNKNSKILDEIEFKNTNGIVIYSKLEKKFNFLEKFDILYSRKFSNSEKTVKCFGIDKETAQEVYKNVEVIYFDYYGNYCVKLKTKEKEEVLLCTINDENRNRSFDEIYQEILAFNYDGEKNITKKDSLVIPNVNIDMLINYEELCGKTIKDTNGMYIEKALQSITFSLNQDGGKLFSETTINTQSMSSGSVDSRNFDFCNPFIIFLKEENANKPYFSLKVEDTNFLETVN